MTEQTIPRAYLYDMPKEQIDDLTRRLLACRVEDGSDRFVGIEIEGSDPFSNIARHLELEVFAEKFGNDVDCLIREYGPYEESSLFFVVIDAEEKTPAAAVRMIRNSAAGLKTLVDMENGAITPTPVAIDDVMRFHHIDDLDRCWDGGSGVAERRYRSTLGVFLAMVRAFHAAVVRDDIAHFVSIQAAPVRRITERLMRVPLVPLANTRPFLYMDAPDSQAVYGHIATVAEMTAKRNRLMGRWLHQAIGVGGDPPQPSVVT